MSPHIPTKMPHPAVWPCLSFQYYPPEIAGRGYTQLGLDPIDDLYFPLVSYHPRYISKRQIGGYILGGSTKVPTLKWASFVYMTHVHMLGPSILYITSLLLPNAKNKGLDMLTCCLTTPISSPGGIHTSIA